MAQGMLGRRLSAQDATFLYAEREAAPMHIGSIAVFDGEISYARFVDNIASKLHLIPRYVQLVVPAPLNIGHPTWEWAPDFDLSRHIKRLRIEAPGTDAQLFDLASQLFAGVLDRDKPLWEMYLVEGLEGNRTGLVSKVHHCLVDGVSGIELLMIVMDVSANPAPPAPGSLPQAPPLPGPLERLIDAVFDNAAAGLDRWTELRKSAVDALTTGDPRARAVMRALETAIPYFSTPMARAPFNKPLTPGRKLACSEFSFAEIRAIRAACGGTVNDVVLAVLGGALSRYLDMHGEQTEGRNMRILTPVNVRREDERGALGNRISMLLVEVPVGVHDPVERLRIINERTDALKRRNVADGLQQLSDLLGGAPPAFQAFAAGLPTPPNTLAHMVCTNVPGPMIPLYSVGHRLLAHYPLVPIAWEMGIGCGVTSYNQKLYFGLIADAEAAADVQRLKEFLDQSFIELRSAAGVVKSDLPQMGVAAAPGAARRRRAPARAGEALAADAG
ncbi:MAG: wax ester/triacylglycerol synthase family O-acyltransferase [Dehalococcoidia bacterium]|nr:wax ester/triacylglycerol synthase family O-acyltransferase [Dehalococcoidia bacterium]